MTFEVTMRIRRYLLMCLLPLFGACDGASGVSSDVARLKDPALIARGEKLFAQHCATCHGARAEATPQWRRMDAEGFFPPPPLDSSAHAWHHPLDVLRQVIRDGSPPGQGKMPAWGDKLSPEEIDAVIAWFQSLWSAEVYAAWYELNQRSYGH